MSSNELRDRARNYSDTHPTLTEGALLVGFAALERERQRQECAGVVQRLTPSSGAWVQRKDACRAILTAGVEPAGPFGCQCWTWDQDHWQREQDGGLYHCQSAYTNCPFCGAKRQP